jgi:hypothetical protein
MELIRKAMAWCNLSVTNEMRRDYDAGCLKSKKDWLNVACERHNGGGDQIGFSACFLAMISYATFCLYALIDGCFFVGCLWFLGTLLALFGVLCFAIPGIDDRPPYVSESTYRRVFELD